MAKGNWLLALPLLALLIVACGARETVDSVQRRELTASDIKYDKSQIEIVAGRPVQLTLHNEGALEHDFSIMHIALDGEPLTGEAHESDAHMAEMAHLEEEPALHAVALPGTEGTVEFTAAEAGEYEYFCTVPGHKEAGMHGTLTVRDP